MIDSWLDRSPLTSLEETTTQALHRWLSEEGVVAVEPVTKARNPVYLCKIRKTTDIPKVTSYFSGVNLYLKQVSAAELLVLQCLMSTSDTQEAFVFSQIVSHLSVSGQDWVLLEELSASNPLSLESPRDINILTLGLAQFHQRGFDAVPIQHKLPHLLGGLLNPLELEQLCNKYFTRGGQVMFNVIADSIESDVQAPHVLLHGDLTPANIMLSRTVHDSKEQEYVVGFIDFEYVSIGNPLWDLGMIAIELTEFDLETTGSTLVAKFEELLQSYRLNGGIVSPEQLETAWAWMVCYWLVAKEWAESNHQPTATYRRLVPAIKEIVRLYSA